MGIFGQKKKKGEEISFPDVISFSIDWPADEYSRGGRLERPVLVLTDVDRLDQKDIDSIASVCSEAGRPGVLLCPAAAVPLDYRGTLALVNAGPLPGQPLEDLLQDLAMLSGARPYLRALGAGIEAGPAPAGAPEGIIFPGLPWSALGAADLGRVDEVELTEQACAIRCRPGPQLGAHVRSLRLQLDRVSDTDTWEGLRLRLRRFIDKPWEVSPSKTPPWEEQGATVIEAGLASAYFVNQFELQAAELEDPLVLLSDRTLHDPAGLYPALAAALKGNRPLLVAAPQVTGAALALLVVNKLRGTLSCAALSTGSSEEIDRLAQIAGVHITSSGLPAPVLAGRLRRVIAERFRTALFP